MDKKLEQLKYRLNRIEDKVTSSTFLLNEGIGNEIGFYVFDYQPQFEITVREHLAMMLAGLNRSQSSKSYLHINLFNLVIEYLKKRELLDEVISLEKSSGTRELLEAFHDILSTETLCRFLVQSNDLTKAKAMLISGVGTCWPFIRAHTILNNLQNYVGKIPVVFFYPGQYSGQDLKPFGLSTLKGNYYRAFPLIDDRL